MEWIKVYDLAEDRDYVERVQMVTLEAERGGLQPEPALFGSPDCLNLPFSAHQIGGVPLTTERSRAIGLPGVIKRPLWTGMNDFPEVEVEESGHVSSWARLGDVTQYSKGRGIRIRWVWQTLRTSIEGLGQSMKLPLTVWLEAGEWQPTAGVGPGPGRSLDEGWEGGPVQ